jgi:hypothetical protein
MIVVTPLDLQDAAIEVNTGFAAGKITPGSCDQGSTGTGTTGFSFPDATLPNAQANLVAGNDLRRFDICPVGVKRMVL